MLKVYLNGSGTWWANYRIMGSAGRARVTSADHINSSPFVSLLKGDVTGADFSVCDYTVNLTESAPVALSHMLTS